MVHSMFWKIQLPEAPNTDQIVHQQGALQIQYANQDIMDQILKWLCWYASQEEETEGKILGTATMTDQGDGLASRSPAAFFAVA